MLSVENPISIGYNPIEIDIYGGIFLLLEARNQLSVITDISVLRFYDISEISIRLHSLANFFGHTMRCYLLKILYRSDIIQLKLIYMEEFSSC